MIERIDKFWVGAIGTTKLHERQVEEIKKFFDLIASQQGLRRKKRAYPDRPRVLIVQNTAKH